MHKNIKLYSQNGEIKDDKYFIRIRDEITKLLLEEMREEGYVPVYDLGPFWYTSRGEKKYYFDLIIYGIYVGKKKAQEIDFWQSGQLMKNGQPIQQLSDRINTG